MGIYHHSNQLQESEYDESLKKWQESRISVTDEYDSNTVVISISGVPIGTFGNFSASIGKAKSKKTFNVTAMAAAALSGKKVLEYEVKLPEDKNNILYIDTEQSKSHCQKTLVRILKLAGLTFEKNNERIEFLNLRKYSPKERIEVISCVLSKTKGIGLVIIDGVRDLLYDINAPMEATYIISMLMKWTDEYQIHIHTILHQNKGDENARGHIGTELYNKAETVIQVEKDKTDGDISKVTPILTRAQSFPGFAFRINDLILPELVSDYVSEPKKVGRPQKKEFDPYFDITKEQHEKALENIFPGMFDELNYSALQEKLVVEFRSALGSFNSNKAAAEITFLKNKRMIVQDNGKLYRFNRGNYRY